MQMNIRKIIYLNWEERYEDMIDHRTCLSWVHKLIEVHRGIYSLKE